MNTEFLNDAFNSYFDKGVAAKNAGNIPEAKRLLLLAAETLKQIADNTPPGDVKKSRQNRVLNILDTVEKMDAPAKIKEPVKSERQDNRDDETKEFAAAEIPDISFADIAGLHDVKRAITTRMINPIKHPEKYAVYNKKTGGGVLLYGPPGTGKTMIAKAIAHEAEAKFYVIKGSDIVSKWVGESEKNINALFEQVRKDARSIIFIDEMDSLFGARGNDPHNDKRVNEFLQQIDGFAGKNPNMLLLGATNRPWDVDSAAVRSGRFSQKIYIPLPDPDARRFLFKLYTKGSPLDADVDIDELVALTEDYSGADIAEICDRAKEEPLEQYIATGEVVKIKQADLKKAIKAVACMVDKAEIARFEKYAGIKSGGQRETIENIAESAGEGFDFDARLNLLKQELGNAPTEENFDVAEIAYQTEGWDRAKIAGLCRTAKKICLARCKSEAKSGSTAAVLTQDDFRVAFLCVSD